MVSTVLQGPESSVRFAYERRTQKLYLAGDFNRAEDMDYEQLQGWLSELQLKRKLFEVNPETYYTTIEERK